MTNESIETASNMATRIGTPKKILAIGGPRNMELLPYLGRQEYVVPVPSKVKFVKELTPLVKPIEVFKYYVQHFGYKDARKLVYIGEDLMSGNAAEDVLKDALLKMWVEQPYPAL